MNQFIRKFSFLLFTLFAINCLAVNVGNSPQAFKANFKELRQKTLEKYSVSTFEERVGRKAKLSEKILLKLLRKEKAYHYKSLSKRIDKYNSTDCDLMILQNGDEIEVKILEVTPNEISYKKCDYLDGPTYTKSRTEIFMVKYANGSKEMVNIKADPINKVQSSIPDPEDDSIYIGAFFIGILCGFLLSLLGLLFCLFFKKGKPRRFFFGGWSLGVFLLIILILSANA